MIRLALQLVCDVCETETVMKSAPELLVRLTRESLDGLEAAREQPRDEVMTRAAEMSFAAIRATESLPAGWTRELIDGWPFLACAGCSALGVRAEATARQVPNSMTTEEA